MKFYHANLENICQALAEMVTDLAKADSVPAVIAFSKNH